MYQKNFRDSRQELEALHGDLNPLAGTTKIEKASEKVLSHGAVFVRRIRIHTRAE